MVFLSCRPNLRTSPGCEECIFRISGSFLCGTRSHSPQWPGFRLPAETDCPSAAHWLSPPEYLTEGFFSPSGRILNQTGTGLFPPSGFQTVSPRCLCSDRQFGHPALFFFSCSSFPRTGRTYGMRPHKKCARSPFQDPLPACVKTCPALFHHLCGFYDPGNLDPRMAAGAAGTVLLRRTDEMCIV